MTEAAQRHFDQYEYNIGLAEEIEQRLGEKREWSCVVRFYAALHLLSAYLIDKQNVNFSPQNHGARQDAISKCPELAQANKRYRKLKDISENVRYTPGFKYTDANDADVKMHIIQISSIVKPKL
jgi:hypothetical protein